MLKHAKMTCVNYPFKFAFLLLLTVHYEHFGVEAQAPILVTAPVPVNTTYIISLDHAILMSCSATSLDDGENSTHISWRINTIDITVENAQFYDFTINTTTITEGGHTFVISTLRDCGFILDFEATNVHKIGQYSCTASNLYGNETATWNTTIHHAQAPLFHTIHTTDSFTVQSFGGDVEMKCFAFAFPWAKYIFTLNGEPIVLENDPRFTVTIPFRIFVTIHDFGPNDLGNYSCIAYNNVGSPVMSEPWSVTADIPTEPPEIFILSQNASEVTFGTSLLINCVAYGYPFPTLTFAKEGVTLENSPEVIITDDFVLEGGRAFVHAVLVLCDVRISEAGLYTCTAHNDQRNHSLPWSISRIIDNIDECDNSGLHNCEHECHNTIGSFECSCYSGYDLVDMHRCVDIDECYSGPSPSPSPAPGTHNCEQFCTNTIGSFLCACSSGFVLSSNMYSCEDLNECTSIGLHNCEQDCHNTIGSFNCSCYSGYDLVDMHRCVDIDECSSGTHNCEHLCNNIIGSFLCACNSGFVLSSNMYSCEDLDECNIGLHNCEQDCHNTIGSFNCSCYSGYDLVDMHRCVDIDECSSGTHNCEHLCINIIGSFLCACNSSFVLSSNMYSCEDLDECNIGLHNCEQDCHNTIGSFNCSCYSGYDLVDMHRCVDIDECSSGTHNCEHLCNNIIGSFLCACNSGFVLSSNMYSCEDLDECNFGPWLHNCEQDCHNTIGSFNCSCYSGYDLVDMHRCVDIDECSSGTHNCEYLCNNIIGSFLCACNSGFVLSSNMYSCEDLDECNIGLHNCEQDCHNTIGSFNCSCYSGYDLVDMHRCVDIDECSSGTHNCEYLCNNIIGSFFCACNSGFVLSSNMYSCEDLDECTSIGLHNCEQDCHNTIGSFNCSCYSGYDLVDMHRCVDIDECSSGTHNCEHLCNNIIGSFLCACNSGFVLSSNMYSCEDLDECNIGLHNCEQDCHNTIGSFNCSCYSGYDLVDMHRCVDIDECSSGTHNCEHLCNNIIGSFLCACNSGFALSSNMYSCLAPPVVSVFGAPTDSRLIGVQPRDGVSGTIALRFNIINAIPPVVPADIKWTYINATSGHTVDVLSTLVDGITDMIDDPTLRQSGRFFMSTSLQTLTIFKLVRTDGGMYTLRAENTVGVSTATIRLDVHIDPMLQDQNRGGQLTLDEEEEVSFGCIADGLPPPIIVWLLNGTVVNTELLSDHDRYRTSSTVTPSNFRENVPQARRSELTVTELQLSDAGVYSCRADPAVIGAPDIANTSFRLNVLPRVIDYCANQPCQNGGTCVNLEVAGYLCECDPTNWKGTNCEIEVINDEPAEIIKGPSINSFPSLFRSINLTCEATGTPQPDITWYKNDVVLVNQRLSYLYIDEVQLTDRGTFYCKASNDVRDKNDPSQVTHHEKVSKNVFLNIRGVIQYTSVLSIGSVARRRRKRQAQNINDIIDSLSSYLSGSPIAGTDATIYSIAMDTHAQAGNVGTDTAPILITVISMDGRSTMFLREQLSQRIETAAMEISSLSVTFNSLRRFDGCPAEMTTLPPLSSEDVPIVLEWPEVGIGVNQSLQCPCGNLSVISGGVNRNAFRFCNGSFLTGSVWDPPLQQACNFSITTRRLCRITALIDEPEEAVDQLEVITQNEEDIGALEISITSALLEYLTEAVVEEESRNLTENVLMVVDNILDVETESIQQSQIESNASARILEVVEVVSESIPIPENETTVVIPLNSFAVSVQEIEEESFEGVSFSAVLGDEFDFNNQPGDQVIDTESLVFEENPQATASITIPDDVFSTSTPLSPPSAHVPLNDTINAVALPGPVARRRRIIHSVYLNDALFVRRNESNLTVGSIVISASISGGITIENLTTPITMQFLKSPEAVENGTNATCSFWDITADDGYGNWSDRGCWVLNETDETVTCACDHLTNFAILLDVSPDSEPLPDVVAKTLLAASYAGAILSIIFLVITIMTYTSSKKLRGSVAGQILINLCLAFIGIYAMFIMGYHSTPVVPLCAVAGGLLHYFLLVAFAIMAAEAVNLYIKLVQVLGCTAIQQRYVLKATLISWIVPGIIVIICLAPNYRNYVSELFCRPYDLPFFLGLIAPFSAIYLMNWIIFIIIFIKLLKKVAVKGNKNSSKKNSTASKVKQQLVIAITLSILFGLGWGAGIPATNAIKNVPLRATLQALFIFLTGFQGVFIFIMHCVRSEEARGEWKKWFRLLTCRKTSRSSSTVKYSTTGARPRSKSNPYGTLSTSAGGRQGSTSTLQWPPKSDTLKKQESSTEEQHIYDEIPKLKCQKPQEQNKGDRKPTLLVEEEELEQETEMNASTLDTASDSSKQPKGRQLIYVNSSVQEENDLDLESDEEFIEKLRKFGIVGKLTDVTLALLAERYEFWKQPRDSMEMNSH